jgi:hypothetical protein
MPKHRSNGLALLGFVAFLAPSLVAAEPVPEEYLTADYELCIEQSSQAPYTLEQRQAYCDCTRDEFAKLDFDEYLQMTGDVLENDMSATTTQYLQSVDQICRAHVGQ